MINDINSFATAVVNAFKAQLLNYLPSDYEGATVTKVEVTKNNDQHLVGISIKKVGSNIAPNVYLEKFFTQYQDERDMDTIIDEIAAVFVENDVKDFDINDLTNYSRVKDRIYARLINTESNKEYLANKPHTEVADLSVMYAVNIGMNANGMSSAPITDGMLEGFGITKEELHNVAIQNIKEDDIYFKTMRDVLVEMMFPDGIDESDPMAMMLPPEEDTPSMYVLSNKNKTHGAVAICNKKIMDGISDRLGGDFIVIPSSIHEVIILPAPKEAMDVNELKSMIQEVNAGEVAPADVLSDHPYIYSKRNGLTAI
jgi:hypothetical protein